MLAHVALLGVVPGQQQVLAPSEAAAGNANVTNGTKANANCKDTASWKNPFGLGCNDYKVKGFCTGTGFAAGLEWTGGKDYAFPEDNCCHCGAGASHPSSADAEKASTGSTDTASTDVGMPANLGVGFEHLATVKPGQEVLYAVATCKLYHSTRASAVYQTWCKDAEACVFYADESSAGTPTAPATLAIEIPEATGLSGLKQAQMRYMRIYAHAADMVLSNQQGLFSNTKWVIVTDDDTYAFHHNMMQYLSGLNSELALYTGHTIADKYYPVNDDGEGHTLKHSISVHFACGGGGSVFSKGAMRKMSGENIQKCIKYSNPGGKWEGWQSDWMFGACAHENSIHLVDQNGPDDRFGQFIYRAGDGAPVLPDQGGTKFFCAGHHGVCQKPVSVHPVPPKGMYNIHGRFGNQEVTSTQFALHEDGHVSMKTGMGYIQSHHKKKGSRKGRHHRHHHHHRADEADETEEGQEGQEDDEQDEQDEQVDEKP